MTREKKAERDKFAEAEEQGKGGLPNHPYKEEAPSAEDKLKESEARYRAVVEDQTELICRFLPGGTLTFVNGAYCRYFGRKREDLINKSLFLLIPPEDHESVREQIALLSADNPAETHENRVIKANGEIGWHEWTNRAIFDEQGRLIEYQAVGRDVTRRKEAEQALRRLETAVEQSIDGIAVANREGCIEFVNRAWAEMHGYSAAELLGKHLSIFHTEKQMQEDVIPFNAQVEKNGASEREIGHARKDGTILPTWMSVTVLRDEEGNPVGLVAIARDITEQKEEQQALAQQRTLLETILRQAGDGIIVRDMDGKLIFANDAARRIAQIEPEGTTLDDAPGVLGEVYDPDGRPIPFEEQPIMRARQGETTVGREVRLVRPDGRFYDLLISAAPLRNSDGAIMGSVVTLTDITARKRAEQIVTYERNKLVNILDSIKDGVCVIGKHEEVQYANPALRMEFGPPEGRKCFEYFHDRTEKCPWCRHEDVFQGQTVRREQRLDKNDKIYELTETPLENPDGSMSYLQISRDITKRKQMEEELKRYRERLEELVAARTQQLRNANEQLREEIAERNRATKALRESEERHRTILRITQDGFWVANTQGQFLEVNDACCAMTGFSREELLSMRIQDIEAMETPDETAQRIRQIAEAGSARFETRHRCKDGRILDIEVTVKFLPGTETFFSFLRDITPHKQAEDALRESEERHRTILRTSQDGFWISDKQGHILEANDAYCAMSGFSRDEVLSMRIQDVEALEAPDEVAQHARHVAETGSDRFETRHRRKDGGIIDVEVSVKYLPGAEQIFSFIRDISARKEAEEKVLAYQNTLRSLGSQLILTEERERQGFATALHDAIGHTLVLAMMKLEKLGKEPAARLIGGKSLDNVCEDIQSAIDATRSLTFELSPAVLYHAGFESAVVSLASQMEKQHSIKCSVEDDGQPKPLADDIRVLLFRAVRELLVNAVKHAEAGSTRVSIRRAGDAIHVCVEDDGIGFDTSEIDSQWDKSKGFGIFSIRERLTHLGGQFEIESKPGCGTRVTLVAPLSLAE